MYMHIKSCLSAAGCFNDQSATRHVILESFVAISHRQGRGFNGNTLAAWQRCTISNSASLPSHFGDFIRHAEWVEPFHASQFRCSVWICSRRRRRFVVAYFPQTRLFATQHSSPWDHRSHRSLSSLKLGEKEFVDWQSSSMENERIHYKSRVGDWIDHLSTCEPFVQTHSPSSNDLPSSISPFDTSVFTIDRSHHSRVE